MKNIFLFAFCLMAYTAGAQNIGDPIDGTFKPQPKTKYVVSCWVLEEFAQQQQTYSHTRLRIQFFSGATPGYSASDVAFLPSGPIIDGWQQISGIFTIPDPDTGPGDLGMKILLENTSTNAIAAYFDDVRFYPYDGNMKSFVYDEDSRKLMAELDESNYATFYEYDPEGGLIRIKKETEKGVYTIKESREKNAR